MKIFGILLLFWTGVNCGLIKDDFTKEADPCDPDICVLPDCRCSDVRLSSAFKDKDLPQLVSVTFDDAVTALIYDEVVDLFSRIINPDGCKAKVGFYVSHEYTDYSKVHSLWAQGHEIGLHSITHGTDSDYWKFATPELVMKEFSQQIEIMTRFANIKRSDIKGMKMPYFEIAGDQSFVVAKKIGLLYDASWSTQYLTDPGLWPYTLDYKSIQDCPIGTCPTASIPGLWINPLVDWTDDFGNKCVMMDACVPDGNSTEVIFEMMKRNFLVHYNGNRAPFGLYLHAAWLHKGENNLEAFKLFLKYLNETPNVYFSTPSQVIDFVKNPKIGMPFDNCRKVTDENCRPRLCPLKKESTGEDRWMTVCGQCPQAYPWIGNPAGKHQKKATTKKSKARSMKYTTLEIDDSVDNASETTLKPLFPNFL